MLFDIKHIGVISTQFLIYEYNTIYNMRQCSRREYHKRRKSVMKRQNEMRKQRVAALS